jgi:hypothetical protein
MRTILYLAVALVGVASCTTSRTTEPPASAAAKPVSLDSLVKLAELPAYLVPPPAGSTPRQRKQWQAAQVENLTRAGHTPEKVKIKNSAVATGAGSTAITKPAAAVAAGAGASATTFYKPASTVAVGAGSSATDARKAGQRGGGGVATGPNSTATGATEIDAGVPWWIWALLVAGCCALGWRIARGCWF